MGGCGSVSELVLQRRTIIERRRAVSDWRRIHRIRSECVVNRTATITIQIVTDVRQSHRQIALVLLFFVFAFFITAKTGNTRMHDSLTRGDAPRKMQLLGTLNNAICFRIIAFLTIYYEAETKFLALYCKPVFSQFKQPNNTH